MIGEKLEEARQRKGITIREAAEATKIRGEYLTAMENNSMEIPLPDIYVRGFLKNYARFLKLDPDKILTDFDARRLRRSGFQIGGDSYGRIEVPIVDEEDEEESPPPRKAPVEKSLSRDLSADDGPEPTIRVKERPGPTLWEHNREVYLKFAVMGIGVVVLVVVLVLMLRLIFGGVATEPDTVVADRAAAQATPAIDREETIVLRANDTVMVIVEQTLDRRRLYSGTLEAGQSIPIEKRGPVSIRFTNGSALTIERDGEQFRPGQSGVGRTMVE